MTSLGTGQTLRRRRRGKIDIFTNGFVRVTELNGDLRVGAHHLDGSDVTLFSPRADPRRRERHRRSSAPTRRTTDVTGVNITMTAGRRS